MRATRRTAAVLSAVIVVVLAGCGGGGEEPVGLATETGDAPTAPSSEGGDEPGSTGEPTSTAQPTPTGPDDGGDQPEPGPTFTQPYIPGDEPSVINLPEELDVEPPDQVGDDEREVLRAVGRFMASWQAILFGADAELSGIEETATGSIRDSLVSFIAQAEDEQWVFTGEPMQLTARSVSVDGDQAEVGLCLVFPGWVEFRGGSVSPYPSPERYAVELERTGDRWVVSSAQEQDAAPCDR
ncbi:hypothetical protein [Phytoactinopolyspora halotolerans]|uniref:Nuclear transport factor 2 family protein n=1 Tax=Phytoactinopolyspora halotolerans TaxID=1981512 RepID=A0A6L9S3C9_9ACTN|nr:hypothetical protein [Phytoactinopolyspora halotolerans]NED99685.1 hypothetical protein [Phytoactinopolyspora halotolerans]